jgi:filamentous hemagglutinin family protein
MKKHILSLLTTTALFLLPTIVHAQTYQPSNRTPVTDSTLGTQVSGSGNNFNITGGLNKGQTLFHSFTDFSVPTNGAANFLNPVGNRDIITRVTGSLFSDINGLVNSNGTNFFLINPNGIVFGTNAQLNVGRAFMASTANGIDLVDGGGRAMTFGTNPNGDAPLLSVTPNVLFNASRLNLGGGNGAISNFGTLQTTNPNQYIGLIGGNVTFNGGKVIAPGGKVDLGGLAAPGSVTWSDNKLIFPTSSTRSNVNLTEGASVSVAGSGGGNIAINAQNLNVLNGSEIAAGINQNAPNSQAGDIDINVTKNIDVGGNSPNFIYNEVFKDAVGNSGKITIKTDSLRVTGGSQISSSTFGTGNAGDLNITANNVLISGESPNASSSTSPFPSGLLAQVEQNAAGKAGNINLITKILSVSNGGKVQAATFGNGDSGTLFIKANEINVFNDSGVSPVFDTQINTGVSFDPFRNIDNNTGQAILAKGNGGKMTIESDRLSIRNGGSVSSDTRGIGNAGSLNIKASDIEVSGRSGISADTYEIGKGNAGDLTITTDRLRIVDGAQISSSTLGQGNAGKLTVNATNSVEIDRESPRTNNSAPVPTGLFAQVEAKATGNAGDLTLTTKKLSVSNGGKVQAATFGRGNGGNLVIKAEEINIFDTPGVNSEQLTNINAGVANDKDRNVDSMGNRVYAKGTAGNLTIETRRLSLKNGVAVTSDTISGQGGNINLNVSDYLLMRQNSQISASAGTANSGGDGGNITINSPLIVALPGNSDITANAYTGKGGTLTIKSDGLFGIQYRPKGTETSFTNDITASSTFGQSGNVQINTPGVDPGKDTGELPAAPNDASRQISQTCSASQRDNKFYITGRGGLPQNASEPQESEALWQDARAVKHKPATTANQPAQLAPPAIGWVFEQTGRVRLIAAQTAGSVTGTRAICPNVRK